MVLAIDFVLCYPLLPELSSARCVVMEYTEFLKN